MNMVVALGFERVCQRCMHFKVIDHNLAHVHSEYQQSRDFETQAELNIDVFHKWHIVHTFERCFVFNKCPLLHLMIFVT